MARLALASALWDARCARQARRMARAFSFVHVSRTQLPDCALVRPFPLSFLPIPRGSMKRRWWKRYPQVAQLRTTGPQQNPICGRARSPAQFSFANSANKHGVTQSPPSTKRHTVINSSAGGPARHAHTDLDEAAARANSRRATRATCLAEKRKEANTSPVSPRPACRPPGGHAQAASQAKMWATDWTRQTSPSICFTATGRRSTRHAAAVVEQRAARESTYKRGRPA